MFGLRRIEAITPQAASDRFFTAELAIVDVRTDAEFRQFRVPGVVHIPAHEIRSRLDEVPTGHPVAFVCRSGHRSASAARLAARHRDDVLNVAGGMNAWIAAGLPVARCRVSRGPTTSTRKSHPHA